MSESIVKDTQETPVISEKEDAIDILEKVEEVAVKLADAEETGDVDKAGSSDETRQREIY